MWRSDLQRDTINLISNMLTLRYNPLQAPLIEPLTASDFVPVEAMNIERQVTDLIERELRRKAEQLKFHRASLSLSAGVDSGLTLSMVRSVLPSVKLDCISVGFDDEDDEVERAEELASIYNCDFQKIILDDIFSELPKLINIVKEPRWNLYHYYAFERGGKNSHVFLAGDGGDELFGGYTFRYAKFLSGLAAVGSDNNNTTWQEKAKLYLSCHDRDWVPDQDKVFGSAIKFSWSEIYRLFEQYFDNNLHPLDQVFLADFNGKLLYDWLPTNKAFENALGLHIESIFLNADMIKFATHIPWQAKYDPDKALGKLPLRRILSKQKGFERLAPIKKGFSVDLLSLWKRSARELVRKYVNADSEIVKAKIIDLGWIDKAWNTLATEYPAESKIRYINKMVGILALEIWYRLFVSHTMTEKNKL